LLSSTNRLGWPEEWFNTSLLEDYSKSMEANSIAEYAANLRFRGQSPNGVFGVVIAWSDILTLWPDIITNAESDFFNHFPALSTKSFALFRKDIIEQAVSNYKVVQTGIYDSLDSSADLRAHADLNFHYNELKIRIWVNHIVATEAKMLDFFKAHSIKPKILVYEDLVAQKPEHLAQYFLDIVAPQSAPAEPSAAIPSTRKIATSLNREFADRFRIDNLAFIEDIECRRAAIFENAHIFSDAAPNSEDKWAHAGGGVPSCAAKPKTTAVSVIIPVYAGFLSVKKCLNSVLSSRSETPFETLVIYDAGPDARVESYLDELADRNLINLHKNDENLGFVRTVNKGFEIAGENDVVILNSDTVVPDCWLDRLVSMAKSDPKIATVTPFTNNGEICSFPNLGEENKYFSQFDINEIDRLFADFPPLIADDIPTGVGFCMFLSRAALREFGGFNAKVFGRGYGEENDFCRRAAAAGKRNVLLSNLYVHHDGGASFGPEKEQYVKRAVKNVERLHPGYNFLVQNFIQRDPFRARRLQLVLHFLAKSAKPVVLTIAHGEGGGTRRYIDELRNYFKNEINFLSLEPVQPGWVRLIFPAWANSFHQEFEISENGHLLEKILKYVGVDLIHINHVKNIESYARKVIDLLDADYIVTLHDYYFLAGNPTLTDASGRYAPELYFSDERTETSADAGETHAPAYWRQFSRGLLAGAKKLIAPSRETRDIYHSVFPELKIDVLEHVGTEIIQKFPPVRVRARDGGRPFRVGVIGALGLEKGADILERVAMQARKRPEPDLGRIEFHLIGFAYRTLDSAVTTHGAYREDQLQGILEKLQLDLVWFPCQWPETYSYTLTAAMDAGLPLLAPALGAMESRTLGRPFTWRHSFELDSAGKVALINQCLRELSANAGAVQVWKNQPARPRYYCSGEYTPRRKERNIQLKDLPELELLSALSQARAPGRGGVRKLIMPLLRRLRGSRTAARIWYGALPEPSRAFVRRLLLGGEGAHSR
jgi:GT2 family glycosyltransferase/LPS sulfotransferase NodH/glycosyltransferase involved in cell wall biosynthesis